MKKVLVQLSDGRLCDGVEVGAEFPVAGGLLWVNASDDVSPETHRWDGTSVTVKPPKTPAEIAAEAKAAATVRIAAIKDELVEHLATNLAGTPAEKAQALAAIGLLRTEMALEKGKL